ncbi:MAG TPA: hypothetical protein VNL17_08595 [Verrucomicrobiae bacterium]|nr:hypothetical protein [Verrucomicrobiae bacterium]
MNTGFNILGRSIDLDLAPKVMTPMVSSFREFLEKHGRVKTPDGSYQCYTFEGREALEFVVGVIDRVLGSNDGQPMSDARLTATGSAQWGKTILELNLLAYAAGIQFRSVGLFLPDEDLVEGIVDSKFRPDVLDQQPWLNSLITLGKAENASGKTVNRKGLFTCTGSRKKSHGMIHGMQKIPTTFSFDIVIEDEKDDIPPTMSRYLTARMTASDLRFRLSIGTQRYAGAGQNKEFEDGTMHLGHFTCAVCGHKQNPEENWPQICRLAIDREPRCDDPQLQLEGNFKRNGPRSPSAATAEGVFEFEPDGNFYLACVQCGHELDRHKPEFVAQHPEREKLQHWSVRISQLLVAAIALKQIVSDWCQNAVQDPDAMKTFYVDRLGLPRSSSQQLDQKILDRARSLEHFDLSLSPRPNTTRFAGLDTGDRCWLTVREVESPTIKRITWLEQLSAERVRARVPQVFELLGVSALFVDAGPLRDLARDLCFLLNGLTSFRPSPLPDPERAVIHFPGGLTWDGANQRWRGLRCAAVEFTLKEGKGVVHKLGITQDGLFYPVIACNRDETIERVVNELLTAAENVIEVIDGKLRTAPSIRLPQRGVATPKIIDAFDAHIISGSRRERDERGHAEHFVDGCENHLLLSDAYSALAESVCAHPIALPPFGAMNPTTSLTHGNRGRWGATTLARRTF